MPGMDCAIQTNYRTQVHMVSNPCCCQFERSGCWKRGAFSSRRPTAWKPGGRSQRDRLLVDPEGGAAVPQSGIHRAIHGVSMPEQPDRSRVTMSNSWPCDARGFWIPGDAPQESHNTPLRGCAGEVCQVFFCQTSSYEFQNHHFPKGKNAYDDEPKAVAWNGGLM